MRRSSQPACLLALSLAAFGSPLGVSTAALAREKSPDANAVESARTSFYRALALQDRGRFAEALELLEKVAETRESAQVRFNIAFNQEHLGRLPAAVRGYERAILLAHESGARNVVNAANERLKALATRVARLVLRPTVGATSVTLDGVALPASDFGRALPVDSGEHRIEARAPGYRPFGVTLALSGGETREVRLELSPEERAVDILPAPLAPVPAATRTVPPAAPGPRREPKPNALPYVAAGVAVVGFATAGVFYALRKDALDTMRAGCDGGRCPDALRATDERGAFYTTAANVALATGVGFAGVSAGLFIAELDAGESEERAVGVRASVATSF
jgi:tetratricopeptide (TPR) repeat protein